MENIIPPEYTPLQLEGRAQYGLNLFLSFSPPSLLFVRFFFLVLVILLTSSASSSSIISSANSIRQLFTNPSSPAVRITSKDYIILIKIMNMLEFVVFLIPFLGGLGGGGVGGCQKYSLRGSNLE